MSKEILERRMPCSRGNTHIVDNQVPSKESTYHLEDGTKITQQVAGRTIFNNDLKLSHGHPNGHDKGDYSWYEGSKAVDPYEGPIKEKGWGDVHPDDVH